MATRGLSGQILSSTEAYVISGLFLMCLPCLIYPGQQGLLFLSFQNLEDECTYLDKRDPTPRPHDSMLMVTLECVPCCFYPTQPVAVQSL